MCKAGAVPTGPGVAPRVTGLGMLRRGAEGGFLGRAWAVVVRSPVSAG